jgi:hypothetical protein
VVNQEWAASESLLGMLQRGHGAGYRRALATPGADALVLECIAHDPRWDRQVEERAGYYARLVVELDIPVDAVPLDVDDPDALLGLGLPVLIELSRSGSAEASGILHGYLARGAEPDWSAVDLLWREGGPTVREGLLPLVLDRLDDQGLAAAVTQDDDGPWRAWAHHPRVAAALAAAPRHQPWPGHPDVGDRTTPELRALADAPASPLRTAAFRELSRRGDLTLLDLAERHDLRNGVGTTSSLSGPVRDLGAAALPRARAWVDGDDAWLRALGQHVIAVHGGHDDAPGVLGWFDEAVEDGEWCLSEDLADGLARLDHRPAVPSIAGAWRATPHSVARAHYLPALVRLGAPDLRSHLDDATHDCESEVRDLARAHLERPA